MGKYIMLQWLRKIFKQEQTTRIELQGNKLQELDGLKVGQRVQLTDVWLKKNPNNAHWAEYCAEIIEIDDSSGDAMPYLVKFTSKTYGLGPYPLWLDRCDIEGIPSRR